MNEPTYEELKKMYQTALTEIERLKMENSKLQAKVLEMQWMIKKYIMNDQHKNILLITNNYSVEQKTDYSYIGLLLTA